jgi:hypothetical protein
MIYLLAKTCQGMENILEIVKAGPSIFGPWVGYRVKGWANLGKIFLRTL